MKKLLVTLWEGWKRIAIKIGRFNTLIILTLFYFLVLAPMGLLMRLFGWDPLETGKDKRASSTGWKTESRDQGELSAIRRQS